MPSDDRTTPSPLKGPLCAVFMPALVGDGLADLQKRLGAKATLSDPERGPSSGHAVSDHAAALAAAFAGATFDAGATVVGTDRDVALGTLRWSDGGRRPVRTAVVAVRKKSREIDVRVYYAHTGDARMELLPTDMRLVLAKPVGIFLDALAEGDVEQAVSLFEEGAIVTDALGAEHGKPAGAMATFLGGLAQGGFDCEPSGSADDGRTCVVEANFQTGPVKRPGVYVFERGDSGLFTRLATYP
ncbi:MAG: nuclear transport factor 2 family protein [Myxococcales bacterium]|jgi:hypothetical protein|nr:nuclear transport factor 2 family protein [Myxococcales bacterium]